MYILGIYSHLYTLIRSTFHTLQAIKRKGVKVKTAPRQRVLMRRAGIMGEGCRDRYRRTRQGNKGKGAKGETEILREQEGEAN